MKMLKKPLASESRQVFRQWYRTATSGRILQSIEAAYLKNSLQLTYQQTILQVGVLGTEHIYIAEEFRNQFLILSPESDNKVVTAPSLIGVPAVLPLGTCTVDVLILPHVLEFEEDPHAVLREVERVLKPEGKLFVLSFNPLSVRGLTQYLPKRGSFWHFNFIPHHRILDWMSLLKFDARFHAAFSTSTAEVIFTPKGLLQCSRAYLSLAYAVRGIKRTYTVIPIEPSWRPAQSMLAGQIAETSVIHKDPGCL